MSDVDELDEIQRALDAVEAAMAKIDEGTYGTCEGCGEALIDAALAQDPTVQRCESCLEERLDG
jgi:RNA polymerase-binding transcription factor DksA